MARLVYGLQPVREAIRAHGTRVERIYLALAPSAGSEGNDGDDDRGPAGAGKPSARLAALGRFAQDQGIAVERVDRARLDRLTRGGRHQGVAAHAPELWVGGLSDLDPGRDCPLLVLDGITDPQNFGAALRSAVALGSGAVLWAEHGAAPLSPAAFRASAGAVEHARLLRVPSLRTALGRLGAAGVLTVALDPSSELDLRSVEATSPVALVIGAEDEGVSRGVRRACQVTARLPMSTRVGSLNASVAAAVALYEMGARRLPATKPEPNPI
jgi:23S rRNA (guanosine2251-2'-O)-methyltransferase